MRVKQPEQFDPEREYKPGERAVINGIPTGKRFFGGWLIQRVTQ